jgi:ATP-binding cassette subfamily F protein uup
VPRKLSFKERREFEGLPARIEALEAERRALGEAIAAPEFYREPAAAIAAALERTESIERELEDLYARWDALDSRPA